MAGLNVGGIKVTTIDEQFVKNFWSAWNSHNWEKTSPFYADNCIMEDLPSKICQDKREIEAYYKYLLIGYPDLNFEAKSCFGSDNKIATEWIMRGTHTGNTSRFKATGKRFSIPGVSILEIQAGKIIHETDYWDMHSLLQQLGLMPSMGQK
jgi:steroid delta-isomerase-like uncharacterized protein